jgi:ribosome biogenesis GTPase
VQEGLVLKSTGNKYKVLCKETLYECVVRGKLRIGNLRTTNPVAVGDKVIFDAESGSIAGVLPRSNYIIRRSVNLSKEAHIVAANIDQAILLLTISRPGTPAGFIDRFLISAEAYHIPVILVVNKCDDLRSTDEQVNLAIFNDTYRESGYQVMNISALIDADIDRIRSIVNGKITLISGNSGVGKTTLVNALCPHLKLRTSEVSDAHQKGKHTTTFAEMFALDTGATEKGFIIDSPGIKGFGLVDISKEELGNLFPEIRAYSKDCKYHNCIHINEPGCAVLKYLEEHPLFESRYRSYLSMLEDIDGYSEKYRKAD